MGSWVPRPRDLTGRSLGVQVGAGDGAGGAGVSFYFDRKLNFRGFNVALLKGGVRPNAGVFERRRVAIPL